MTRSGRMLEFDLAHGATLAPLTVIATILAASIVASLALPMAPRLPCEPMSPTASGVPTGRESRPKQHATLRTGGTMPNHACFTAATRVLRQTPSADRAEGRS